MFNYRYSLFFLVFISYQALAETLTVGTTGNGTITSASLNCGSQCTATYAKGEVVTLTATPNDATTRFAEWSGHCEGTSNTTFVVMSEAKTCRAKFEPMPVTSYELTVVTTEYGKVTSQPGTINCGTTCSAYYNQNTQVKLLAQPAASAEFVEWGGACSGNALETALTLNEAKSCIAKFKLKPVALKINLAGQGNVTSEPAGIDCGPTCTALYEVATEVTLTAEGKGEFVFASWGGDCLGQENPLKLSLDQAKTCIADFALSLTVDKQGEGTVTSEPPGITCGETCETTYKADQEVTLTAVAAEGYEFTAWAGHCQGQTPQTKVTLNKAKQCSAVFDLYLTVEKAGQGLITSDGGDIECGSKCKAAYAIDDKVTLTAQAEPGYQFIDWQGDCLGTKNETLITLDKSKHCLANFALLLTLEKSGGGEGTLTSDPEGIDCGETCSAPYALNQKITLTAQADTTSEFTGWGGDCEGVTPKLTVTLDKAKTCQANFVPLPPEGLQNLTVITNGNGAVTSQPQGINCGDNCVYTFEKGMGVLLTAVAQADSKFNGWSGDCHGTTPAITVTLAEKPITCAAKFELLPPTYKLVLETEGGGQGNVTTEPAGVSCGPNCWGFAENTTVKVAITLNPNSKFIGWSGWCVGPTPSPTNPTPPATVTIDNKTDKKCTAHLQLKDTFNLTVVKTGIGDLTSEPIGIKCGDSECVGAFYQGALVKLSALADPRAKLSGWSGACVGNGNTVTLVMDAAKTCTVTFEPKPTLLLQVVKTGNGEITGEGIRCGADCEEIFPEGSSVLLTAQPQPDSFLKGWSGCPANPKNPLQTIINLTAATVCTATFELFPPLKLTVTKQGSGTGSVTTTPPGISCGDTCSADYLVGTVVTLTAQPSADSIFTGWRGACHGTENATKVTLVEEAKTCTALFYLLPPPAQFNLTVTEAVNGKVTSEPAGLECESQCTLPYPNQTVVTLTATPNQDWVFTSWSGDCEGAQTKTGIVMEATKVCTANFYPIPPTGSYLLTVAKHGKGTVTSAPSSNLPVLDCGEHCTQAYSKGSVINLMAKSAADYIFGGWQCGETQPSEENPLLVTVNENLVCTVHFEPAPSSLQFAIPQYLVNELDGEAILLVTRAASRGGVVSVDYTTLDETALAGSDYQAKSGTLVWADGDTSHKIIRVPILADEVTEGEETLKVVLSNPTGKATLASEQATLTIIDTPPTGAGLLQFSALNYLGTETSQEMWIGVDRIGGSIGAIAVSYATTPVTATAGSDYVETQGVLNWSAGETTTKFFKIPMLRDEIAEGPESVMLTLTNPVGGANLGALRSANLQIVDSLEQGMSVLQFLQAAYLVLEGEPAVVTVSLLHPSQEDVSVKYTLQPETAQVESDYRSLPTGVLSWAAGDFGEKSISIPTVADAVAEGEETFRVTLSNPTGPVSLGAISSSVVKIEGQAVTPPPKEVESPGVLQFLENHYQVSESGGSITITVSRTQGHQGVVEVTYLTQANTAQTSRDYLGVQGSLRWLDGDSENKSFKIGILDNGLPQADKTLSLLLSAPTGGARLGENSQATLTILDNDTTTLQLAATAYSVTEDGEKVLIEVTRAGGNVAQVGVNYETTDVTAQAGQDYVPSSGRLTWVSGDSQPQTLAIPIKEDKEVENTETFQVRLTMIEGNASFGTPSETTVSILDDDTTECKPPIIDCVYVNTGTLQDPKITQSGTVSGGQLGGAITNEGIIEDVTLLPNARVQGGSIRGRITGDPAKPAILLGVNIAPDTILSHLVISPLSKLDSSVKFQEDVCFEDNSTIPSVTDLVGILGRLNTPHFSVNAVRLTGDVLCLPAEGGILGAINGLEELNGMLQQNPETGYLEMELEPFHYAVLPVQVNQILKKQVDSSIAQGMLVNPDGQITWVTHTSREIVAVPVVQEPSALREALGKLGLRGMMMQKNGNLTIPVGDGTYYSARPDLFSMEVAADSPVGLDITSSAWSDKVGIVGLVFEQADKRRQQMFYPAPADPSALSQETQIFLDGRVSVQVDSRRYQGLLDYLVKPGDSSAKAAKILEIEDLNADGWRDYQIIYPNGDRQIMYQVVLWRLP